jgi:ABC-2 type transport system permease protein
VVALDEGGVFSGGSGLPALLQEAAATARVQELAASGEAARDVLDVLGSDPLEQEYVNPADPDDEARSIVAYAGLMLLYVTILFNGTMVLTAVTEEKTNRVVEVLLAALRPWQLLAGKVIAVGLLGVAQVGLTVAAGLAALQATNPVELPEIPLGSAAMLVVWFVLGYALYAVLLASAGALVGRAEDAQSTVMPLNIVIVAAFFVSFAALGDPAGLAAIIGTWVPITAPFTVPIRHAMGEISALELVGSILVVTLSIVLAIRLAGRIYAGALLRTGSRVRIREAWRGGSETVTAD